MSVIIRSRTTKGRPTVLYLDISHDGKRKRVDLKTSDMREAKRIAAEDPMHKAGARSFTVRPWLLNEGTVTLKVTYSDGKRELI